MIPLGFKRNNNGGRRRPPTYSFRFSAWLWPCPDDVWLDWSPLLNLVQRLIITFQASAGVWNLLWNPVYTLDRCGVQTDCYYFLPKIVTSALPFINPLVSYQNSILWIDREPPSNRLLTCLFILNIQCFASNHKIRHMKKSTPSIWFVLYWYWVSTHFWSRRAWRLRPVVSRRW